MRNDKSISPLIISMHLMRFACTIVMVGFLLNACGVKSAPQHPDGSDFPVAYPPMERGVYKNNEGENKKLSVSSPSRSLKGMYQYPNLPNYKPPKN